MSLKDVNVNMRFTNWWFLMIFEDEKYKLEIRIFSTQSQSKSTCPRRRNRKWLCGFHEGFRSLTLSELDAKTLFKCFRFIFNEIYGPIVADTKTFLSCNEILLHTAKISSGTRLETQQFFEENNEGIVAWWRPVARPTNCETFCLIPTDLNLHLPEIRPIEIIPVSFLENFNDNIHTNLNSNKLLREPTVKNLSRSKLYDKKWK